MLRNFQILNVLPFQPALSCLKNTGPGLSSLIAIATTNNKGLILSNINIESSLSSIDLVSLLIPVNGVSESVITGIPAISLTLWLINLSEKISGIQCIETYLSSNTKYSSSSTLDDSRGVTI